MAKPTIFLLMVVCTSLVLMLMQNSTLALNLTIQVNDAYTQTYAAQDIPLVFGRTNSYATGLLGFTTYRTVWINGSDNLSVTSPIPSKTYIFFTRRNAEITQRAGLIFSGVYEDYGKVTIGYSLGEDKIIRIVIVCDDCSFTKKWYIAYGTSTILFRNEGITNEVSKVEVDLL